MKGEPANRPPKDIFSLTVISLISIYLLLPLLLTFFYSLFRQWNTILPKNFTLEHYVRLFADGAFLAPLIRTVVISFLPVAICAAAVLMAVYVTSIIHPGLEKYIQIICTIPYALQGVILAISVLSLYSGMPLPFSNRIVMLVGTYCVVILPYMYRGIQNSLTAVDAKSLMSAAQLLGLSHFGAYVKVIVPNIVKGIKVSVMLSVALLFGDFVIVNIIGGSYYTTAQTYLYHHLMHKSGQRASALIVVMFIVTLIISASAFTERKKKLPEAEGE